MKTKAFPSYTGWLNEHAAYMDFEILWENRRVSIIGRGDTLIEVDNSKTLQLMNLIKGLTIEQQEAVYSLIKAFK